MVAVPPGLVLGLDLHGTLLEPGEIIRPEMIGPVAAAIARLRDRVSVFICTGNDLEFVLRKVPGPILAQVSGHVLETGCSWSPDGQRELVLTRDAERRTISELEAMLREAGFKEINYFAHRLTTISMFCDDPREFFGRVRDYVAPTRFHDLVHITYSSVAVDILPRGYNKAQGLKAVAGGRPTIGVADSMNDLALLAESDYAFAPSNLAPELVPILADKERKVGPMNEINSLRRNTLAVAGKSETEGVIDILEFLHRVSQGRLGSADEN
jgi:hydroxymethylpyrimidine pyrophosphatase-like HAD family hydrolase